MNVTNHKRLYQTRGSMSQHDDNNDNNKALFCFFTQRGEHKSERSDQVKEFQNPFHQRKISQVLEFCLQSVSCTCFKK